MTTRRDNIDPPPLADLPEARNPRSPGERGMYVPFHVYSARQAVEEGFILDVLAQYVTYETYWNIEKA